MTGKVALKGLEFHSFHGVYDFEKKKGNVFHVDVSFVLDLEAAGRTDQLEDTIDYVAVYNEIASVMERPVNLLERLAYTITESLLDKFPIAQSVEVTVSKDAPPVGGICRESVVTLSRSRGV